MRLLVVDDDPGLLALIRTTFEDVEVEVGEATSSAFARRSIAAAPPDVIVLDVRLAGESGLDLCRELKGDLRTASIPIVLLSGLVDLEPRLKARAAPRAASGTPNVEHRAPNVQRPAPIGQPRVAFRDGVIKLAARS